MAPQESHVLKLDSDFMQTYADHCGGVPEYEYDIVTEVSHQGRFEVGAKPFFLLLLLSFATDFA